MKETHSKLNNLEYNQFKMQKYFKASRIKITQEEIQIISKLWSRMIDGKLNSKGKYKNLECQGCKIEEASPPKNFECIEIMEKWKR